MENEVGAHMDETQLTPKQLGSVMRAVNDSVCGGENAGNVLPFRKEKFTVVLMEFGDGAMHTKLNLMKRDARTSLMVAHALREMAEALEEDL